MCDEIAYARTHKLWVGQMNSLRLFTMNVVASDGTEIFLRVYACVCVF